MTSEVLGAPVPPAEQPAHQEAGDRLSDEETEYVSDDSSVHFDEDDILAEEINFTNPQDYTKAYNRQRKLNDPGVPEDQKPKVNPQHLGADSEDVVPGRKNKLNTRVRVDDQLNSLSHLADKLRLDELPGTVNSHGRKDRANRATTENVLDPRTRLILLQMQNKNVFETIDGCVSTGKEANVYHASRSPDPSMTTQAATGGAYIPPEVKSLAIKVYKTAILPFKNRDRYIQGEHRFRHYRGGGGSIKNSRKMINTWAEKELRNLKRLHSTGLPVPQPFYLKSNVLVMQFLGNSKGYAYPRLKDVELPDNSDESGWQSVYRLVIVYMRTMYQACQLVHGDLSEFNMLFDPSKQKLYIIDVSQSVEKSHPRSLEFLRMDIKNVRDFFAKKGAAVVSERETFEFIINHKDSSLNTKSGMISGIKEYERRREECTEEERIQMEQDDEVFRQQYIPKTLEEVADIEGDIGQIDRGNADKLVYHDLLATEGADEDTASASDSASQSSQDSDEESGSHADDKKTPRGHRFEDKEDKKARKQQVKEEKREKRKDKMKKHVKRKIVAATARPKRK